MFRQANEYNITNTISKWFFLCDKQVQLNMSAFSDSYLIDAAFLFTLWACVSVLNGGERNPNFFLPFFLSTLFSHYYYYTFC